MELVINNLRQIMEAMNILEFKGYNQCKTYTNIMESLQTMINLVSEQSEIYNECIEQNDRYREKYGKLEDKETDSTEKK